MPNYKKDYFGYVYLWRDRKRKMYYLGGHYGLVEDKYICSSKYMLNAYNKRPKDFKMRIVEYVKIDDKSLLREREQYYLDLIDDSELSTSKNVMAGNNRYYNMKKFACGGNGGANKGNSNIGGWNKGLTPEMIDLRKKGLFFLISDKPKIKLKTKPKQASKRKTPSKKIYITKSCDLCNIKFETTNKNQKYCSRKCFGFACRKIPVYSKTVCPKCDNIFMNNIYDPKLFCSLHCARSHNAKKCNSAENGRKSAKKQSQTVIGRKRQYRTDGSWFWIYPNKAA